MAYNMMPVFSLNRKKKFWNAVAIGGENECWEWTRSKDRNGYGHVAFGSRGSVRHFASNRVSFFLTHGVDPAELVVMHSCDNPSCCNPSHLSLGTKLDNTRDCIAKNRFPRGERYDRKLSDIDVYIMREMWFSGLFSQRTIAKHFSVSSGMADLTLRGRNWSHIPMPEGAPPSQWIKRPGVSRGRPRKSRHPILPAP